MPSFRIGAKFGDMQTFLGVCYWLHCQQKTYSSCVEDTTMVFAPTQIVSGFSLQIPIKGMYYTGGICHAHGSTTVSHLAVI